MIQQQVYSVMNKQDRAVTPVISTILMVAIVVILAATVSVFFLDTVEDINEPAPNVADTTGDFEPESDGYRNNQIVRITHIAGEGVPVEELEIVVRASGPGVDAEARLINLPADGLTLDNKNFADGDPNNLIDNGGSTQNNVIISDGIDVWSAGQTITFRINTGSISRGEGADFREDPNGPEADRLEIIIVHTPSRSIISQNTFTP